MDFNLAARRDQAPTLSTWVVCSLLALGFGVACWMLIYIVNNGAQLKANVESQRAEEIKQENLEVCSKLGMPPEIEAFVNCAAELANVRHRHEERHNRDFYFQ